LQTFLIFDIKFCKKVFIFRFFAKRFQHLQTQAQKFLKTKNQIRTKEKVCPMNKISRDLRNNFWQVLSGKKLISLTFSKKIKGNPF